MKRAPDEQITKDSVRDDEPEVEEKVGEGFERAPDDVMASRRILKVRRSHATDSNPNAEPISIAPESTKPAPSPFASISFAKPSVPQPQNDAEKPTETAPVPSTNLEIKKTESPKKSETPATAASEEKESSTGTGTAQPLFSFGAVSSASGGIGSGLGTSSSSGAENGGFTFGSLASSANAKPFVFSVPTFGTNTGAGGSVFAGVGAGTGLSIEDDDPEKEVPTGPCAPILPEQEIKTGEEDEEERFKAKGKAYRLEDGSWKERGVGFLKLNVETKPEKKENGPGARIVMRTDGSMRVMLNFALWKEFKVDQANEKSVRFIAPDDETKKPTSFLVKFSNKDDITRLTDAVESWKSSKPT
uniref:RanBD1 domain-containing protein n=1 Tax=Timspurckia oligopyrenoides TaxID=708627 RepID=A0A7S0ZDG7_9RHOD|mmetsp:Transcript_13526/g.24242  ORF Transcript_13526/g.24242 Transcript_13526/m.24242 type:complete len:359 (+) Transcript_13526:157-1233(+)